MRNKSIHAKESGLETEIAKQSLKTTLANHNIQLSALCWRKQSTYVHV